MSEGLCRAGSCVYAGECQFGTFTGLAPKDPPPGTTDAAWVEFQRAARAAGLEERWMLLVEQAFKAGWSARDRL